MIRFFLPTIIMLVWPLMRAYADGGAQGVFLLLGGAALVALAVLCIVGRTFFPANLQASRRAKTIVAAAWAGGFALSVPLSGLLFTRSLLFPAYSDSLVNVPRLAFVVSVPLFVAVAVRFIVRPAAPGRDAMLRRAFIILALLSLPVFAAGSARLAETKANLACDEGLRYALGLGVKPDWNGAQALFAAARDHSEPPCLYGDMSKDDLAFAAKNIRRGRLVPDARLNRVVKTK
jgi:hypothetical protein